MNTNPISHHVAVALLALAASALEETGIMKSLVRPL